MANLVLGVVGGVIGWFAGGPVGAQYGFMIGAAVGTAVSQETIKSEGPRLGDAQITSSTLGTPMALLYGGGRVAGNVIWASKIREVPVTESQGKGGPSAESTTYTYNVDVAIDLCEGPATGIRKIWSDGKLTYDISADMSAESALASGIDAAGYAFYSGSEDQLPDPTMEAIVGVGMTPAYRGRCYVVFSQLACPGGRIPQLTFEVLQDADEEPSVVPFAPYGGGSWVMAKNTIMEFQASGYAIDVTKRGVNYVEYVRRLGVPWGTEWLNQSGYIPCVSSSAESATPAFFAVQGQSTGEYSVENMVRVINLESGEQTLVGTYHTGFDINPAASYIQAPAAHDNTTGGFVVGSKNSYYGRSYPQVAQLWGVVGAAALAARSGVIYHYDAAPGITMRTPGGNVIGTIAVPVADGSASLFAPDGSDDLYLMRGGGFGGTSIYRHDGVQWHKLVSGALNGSNSQGFYACKDYAIVGPAASGPLASSYRIIRYKSLVPRPRLVRDVIIDQCARAGIAADRLEFVGVDDVVHGYPVARVSSARANIQPLQAAFFIDVTEVDLKLVFTKRASAPVAPLVRYDELAASEDGAPGDPLPLVRAQEEEFPRSVTVSYMDLSSDYQIGAEAARRIVTKSINDVASSVPICTTSDHAKKIAEVQLYESWNGRDKRRGALTRRYAYLVPGDVVPIEYPRGTIQQWLLISVRDTGVLIEFDCVPANADLYTIEPPGSAPGTGQGVAPLPTPTNLAVLDIPILRDADDDAGVYVAMSAVGPAWRGATLYVGKDGANMQVAGRVSTSSPIGFTSNALGGWDSKTVDESNVLEVSMGIHTLESATRAGVLDDGVNACALGAPGRWEIIQFIRALSLGNGRYRLSGLVRGLRGTERQRGTHQPGDTLVLLVPAGIARPSFDVGELNQSRQFRAASVGRSADSVPMTPGINTGAGLRPLPVINLRAAAVPGGYTRVTWDRRTRMSENWLAGLVPLGESAEAYEVEVREASGNLMASEPVTTPSYDYGGGYAVVASHASTGISFATVVDGAYIGSEAQTQNLAIQRRLLRLSESGGLLAASPDLGNLILSVDYSATSAYVVSSDVVSNQMVNSKIRRLARSTLAIDATNVVSSTSHDVQSIAFDGTSLWVVCLVSQQLLKLNSSTLATVASTAMARPTYVTFAGGYLYIISRYEGKLIKWDCATNAQVWQIAVESSPYEVLEANGLLVVTAPSSISIYRATTGDFVGKPSPPDLTLLDAVYARNIYRVGGTVQVLCSQRTEIARPGLTVQQLAPAVAILDAETGELQRMVSIDPLANRASGVSGDSLITSTLTSSGAYGFALNSLRALASGQTITVYQMSSSVGRGIPATITL